MLETLDHADNSFVTLTYEKDPVSLEPSHLRNWLKRLRKRVADFPTVDGQPRRIRYFAVGEYGDNSARPHYHAALFGWPDCRGSGSKSRGVCSCLACSVVRETWGYGHVMCAGLGMQSAQYIAGYVTKKMTHREDIRLHGRHPEFARMSLVPGIGANALHNVASEMMRYGLEKRGDVPLALNFGGRHFPLGKYLRGRLRELVDSDEKFKNAGLQTLANQMQILRSFAWANARSVSSVFEELNEPYARQLAARISLKERTL